MAPLLRSFVSPPPLDTSKRSSPSSLSSELQDRPVTTTSQTEERKAEPILAAQKITSKETDEAGDLKIALAGQGVSNTNSNYVLEDTGETSRYEATTKYLLHHENSPLAKTDIMNYLARPDSWINLTDNEREELRSLLPLEMLEIDTMTGFTRPSSSFLRSEPMRDAVSHFKENLSNGYYAPVYLRRAAIAMEERRQGKFDEVVSTGSP